MLGRSVALSLLVLPLAAAGCAVDPADDYVDDTSADALGKADDVSPGLVAAAKAYAEGFDFEDPEHPTRVAREDEPTTGPTWVRRAFALHFAWEDLDLGSANLFRWSVARHRVWAIRTSTDGDDSFVELFDADGDWLATGTGGYGPDPSNPDEFIPLINWDTELGGTRDGITPRDLTEEVAAFWGAFDPLAADGSISTGDARALTAGLVAGAPTTDSLDGHERAAVRRVLADRAPRVSAAARRHLEAVVEFYKAWFQLESNLTAPSITTVLGLPASLSAKVRFSRGTLTGGSYLEPGARTMNQLAQRLGTFATGALPSTAAELGKALRAAGATASQADTAIARIGAADPAARVFAGGLFHVTEDWQAVADAGTSWFVATPARGFVSFLQITP